MREQKPEIGLNREDIYQIVAENTSDAIVLVDSDAIVRYVSPSIKAMIGYSVEEYEGMDAFEVIVPEDRERISLSLVHAVEARQPVDVDYRVLHKGGQILYAEARVRPVLGEDGSVTYVVAVVRDVSERKQTEHLLESILENVNASVFSVEKDFSRYTYLAGNMEKLSGLPRETIMANPIRMHDHIHPDDNIVLMGVVKDKLDRGEPIRQAFRSLHVEGEIRWGQMIIHPYLTRTGEIERLDGIVLDITEKMRAEQALEESEQRYKSLFEHNLDGVFSIDLEGLRFVNANRAFEQLTGIQVDIMKDRCFIGLIYDEDHASVYQTLVEVMQQGVPRDVECRLAGMESGERIVSISFVPIFLSGNLNGIHGILKDITKRKHEERELIRSEERSKQLQMSLNRLSSDLTNVMKVSELESRLLEEVRHVLDGSDAAIVEQLEELGEERGQDQGHPGHTIQVKIGEKPQPVYLRIRTEKPLPKMEEDWLRTAVRYVTILYDNLHRTEDLMKRLEDMMSTSETPKWMLRLLFKLSEKERASLSSDLHDSVLQDLIIWYRKLESLRSATAFEKDTQAELMHIEEGLLDAIHQIRITCNELRPPFLLKMGLVESLKSLFSYARMFANYEIEFSTEQMNAALNEDQILGVYRIVQELLNNANKHSRATKVTMSLADTDEHVHFRYSDDGVGVALSRLDGSFQHMGIAGIEKRVLSLEGEVAFRSAPQQGFHVTIQFPKQTLER